MPRASSWTISRAIAAAMNARNPARKLSWRPISLTMSVTTTAATMTTLNLTLSEPSRCSGLRTGRPSAVAVDAARHRLRVRQEVGLGLAEGVADAVDRAHHVVAELAAQRPHVRVDGPG